MSRNEVEIEMMGERDTWSGRATCRALAAGALTAVAQLALHGQDPVAPWLRYSVGKVVVLPHLDLSSFYTDNLFSLGGASRVPDLVTSITPGLRLKWDENARVDTSLGYRHGETLILDNSGFNSRSDTIDCSISYTTPKVKVRATGNYSDMLALMSGRLNVGRQLVGTKRANSDLRATYDWTPKTDVTGLIQYGLVDNDSRFLIDSQQLEGHAGAAHEITSKLRLTFDGKGGWTQAKGNDQSQQSVDSLFYGALVGLRGIFTPKITGSTKVGYEVRDMDGGIVSASTPAFGVDVTYQPTVMTQVVLAYDRTTGIGAWAVEQVSVNDSVRLQVNKALGSNGRWRVSSGARLGFGRVQQDVSGTVLVSRDWSDQSMAFDLVVQYQPQPWLACAARYSHERFDISFDDPRAAASTLATSYFANRVGVSVSVGF